MRAFDRCCLCRGLLGAALALAARSAAAGDFAIRDGDTVVFLGDSVTAAGTYGKIVEKANAQIESLQRTIARPRPYRFVVRPAP